MEVVSVVDGKNLGRVCDLAFFYPEGQVKGFFVTGSKGFKFTKSDVFIPLNSVVKIGEDVILVKHGKSEKPDKPDCPPPKHNCPPPCPPPCPPKPPFDPRRDFGDYE